MFFPDQPENILLIKKCSGQSMVEFIIIWPLLVLLVLGTFQLALLYQVKTTLNYAAFEGARLGSFNNADFLTVQQGIARGMAPMFATEDSIDGVQEGRDAVYDEMDDGYYCIQRISPTDTAFDDFASSATDDQIPNDNLLYRSPSVGAASGVSIQDANLLKIRIVYCAKLIVPIVNASAYILRGDSSGDYDINTFRCPEPDPGSTTETQGRIPIVAHGIIRMQSAAKDDDSFDSNCNL